MIHSSSHSQAGTKTWIISVYWEALQQTTVLGGILWLDLLLWATTQQHLY